MNIEKMIDVAVNLRIATLKAREYGIIGMTTGFEIQGDTMLTKENFQIYSDKDFRDMIACRPYTIKRLDDDLYKYEYDVKVCGLNFIHITTDLLNADDEDKIEREEI